MVSVDDTPKECHPDDSDDLGLRVDTVKRRSRARGSCGTSQLKHLKGRLPDPKFRLNVNVQGGDTTSFSPNPRFLVSQANPHKSGPFFDTGAARCPECGHQR